MLGVKGVIEEIGDRMGPADLPEAIVEGSVVIVTAWWYTLGKRSYICLHLLCPAKKPLWRGHELLNPSSQI